MLVRNKDLKSLVALNRCGFSCFFSCAFQPNAVTLITIYELAQLAATRPSVGMFEKQTPRGEPLDAADLLLVSLGHPKNVT